MAWCLGLVLSHTHTDMWVVWMFAHLVEAVNKHIDSFVLSASVGSAYRTVNLSQQKCGGGINQVQMHWYYWLSVINML